jgi:hypothetical protein
MPESFFAPGFRRLSLLDVFVLCAGSVGALAFGHVSWPIGFVIGFVVAHFFLFCNVFRLARKLELAWAALFITLVGCTILLECPSWLTTTAVTLGATVAVVALEMRKPSYHGIGWRRINPQLRAWWDAQFSSSRES